MHTTANSHVNIDDQGVARIDGTRMKVIHVVKEMRARSASVAELQDAFPHLSIAQIHAALAYYYDNRARLDAQIRIDVEEYDVMRARAGESPGRGKLRDLGHLP